MLVLIDAAVMVYAVLYLRYSEDIPRFTLWLTTPVSNLPRTPACDEKLSAKYGTDMRLIVALPSLSCNVGELYLPNSCVWLAPAAAYTVQLSATSYSPFSMPNSFSISVEAYC